MDEFIHQPLETQSTIRILILQSAGAVDDPLIARLEHHPLRNADDRPLMQDYIAVSYTWGQEGTSESLICNNASIRITPTVDIMLRRFRTSHKTRRLWIDAICLNQSNHAEKSSQIPQMSNIYRSAKKVFVWLGEPAEPDLNPLDAVSMLMFEQQTSQQRVLMGMRETMIVTLLQNIYWRRRWVIQEIASHPHTTLHLGDQKFSWKIFTSIVMSLEGYIFESQARKDLIQTLVDRIKALNGTSRPLMDLLYDFHAAECSDPRDVLAALHGMAMEAPDSEIKRWNVNYNEPCWCNYTRFAEAAVNSGYSDRIFDHLTFFGHLTTNAEEAPAWVPDWTRRITNFWPGSNALTTFDTDCVRLPHSIDFRGMVRARINVLQTFKNSPDATKDLLQEQSSIIDLLWDMLQHRSSRTSMELSLRGFFRQILKKFGPETTDQFQLEERMILILQYFLPLKEMYTLYCRGTARESDRAGRIAWAWLAINCSPDDPDRPRTAIKLARESCPAIRGLWSLDCESGPVDIGLDILDLGFLNDIIVPSFTELFWTHAMFATDSGQGLGIAERNVQGDVGDKTSCVEVGDTIYWESDQPGLQVVSRRSIIVSVTTVASRQAWRVRGTQVQTPQRLIQRRGFRNDLYELTKSQRGTSSAA